MKTSNPFDSFYGRKLIELDSNIETLIRSIARGVRSWCEDRDQLERFPSEHLGGWCAIASAHLWRELKRCGVEAEIRLACCNYYSHCYVVVEDHIVDITATQFAPFKDSPVVIMHEREAAVYEFYHTTEVFETAQQLRKWQKKNRWPAAQICYEEYL